MVGVSAGSKSGLDVMMLPEHPIIVASCRRERVLPSVFVNMIDCLTNGIYTPVVHFNVFNYVISINKYFKKVQSI